jgi:hypothetical protein
MSRLVLLFCRCITAGSDDSRSCVHRRRQHQIQETGGNRRQPFTSSSSSSSSSSSPLRHILRHLQRCRIIIHERLTQNHRRLLLLLLILLLLSKSNTVDIVVVVAADDDLFVADRYKVGQVTTFSLVPRNPTFFSVVCACYCCIG